MGRVKVDIDSLPTAKLNGLGLVGPADPATEVRLEEVDAGLELAADDDCSGSAGRRGARDARPGRIGPPIAVRRAFFEANLGSGEESKLLSSDTAINWLSAVRFASLFFFHSGMAGASLATGFALMLVLNTKLGIDTSPLN